MKPVFKTEDFAPQIWETTHGGQALKLLVCGRRYVHSPFTKLADGGQVCETLMHPIAVLMTSPPIVICALEDSEHTWRVSTAEEHGLPRRHAQTALNEAWRLVESIHAATWPSVINKFQFKANALVSNDESASPQEKTCLRNVVAVLNHAKWTKLGLSMGERANELCEMGIPATAGQVRKCIENLGI